MASSNDYYRFEFNTINMFNELYKASCTVDYYKSLKDKGKQWHIVQEYLQMWSSTVPLLWIRPKGLHCLTSTDAYYVN